MTVRFFLIMQYECPKWKGLNLCQKYIRREHVSVNLKATPFPKKKPHITSILSSK
jgi:hypothetical protein